MTGKEPKKLTAAAAFRLATAALLIFGILAQILCEAMGYTSQLLDYLLRLLCAGGVFFLLYHAVRYLRSGKKGLRIPACLLLIAVILWSMLAGAVLLQLPTEDEREVVYKIYAWTDPAEELLHMRSRSRLFGHGDPYYEYPDELMEGYSHDQDDLPLNVSFAFDERHRTEAVFRTFRSFRTLSVLSYIYGLWVSWLFAIVGAVWCICSAAAFFRVRRVWAKLTYLLCWVIVAAQVVLPALTAFGVLYTGCSHAFSANWEMNCIMLAPQLGIMYALTRSDEP